MENLNLKIWIHIVLLTTLTSITLSLDCATTVQICPTDENSWLQRRKFFMCATNRGYVCMRDSTGHLFESCMDSFIIPANSRGCPIILACRGHKPFLGPITAYHHCPEQTEGCPPKNHVGYSVYQLYKYPKCIETNLSVYTNKKQSFLSTREANIGQVNGHGDKHIVIAVCSLFLIIVIYLTTR